MKTENIKDAIKASIIVAWGFISLALVVTGANIETTNDGEGFSFSFFLGMISGVLCISIAKSWLNEDQDKKDESPYHEQKSENRD